MFAGSAFRERRRVAAIDDSVVVERAVLGDAPLASLPVAQSSLAARATLLVAAQLVGVAEATRDQAVGYAKIREQFGQPIGAFQAVKHQLADLAMELEPSISLWWYAAHAYDDIPEQAERHAALAGEAALGNARSASDSRRDRFYRSATCTYKRAHLLGSSAGRPRRFAERVITARRAAWCGPRTSSRASGRLVY
jgi:hypothetical protein